MQKPLYVSRSSESYLTAGCWSPSRPAVLYVGLIDGTIEIWDLLEATHQPSMIVHASSNQVTTMVFWKLKSINIVFNFFLKINHLSLIQRKKKPQT